MDSKRYFAFVVLIFEQLYFLKPIKNNHNFNILVNIVILIIVIFTLIFYEVKT